MEVVLSPLLSYFLLLGAADLPAGAAASAYLVSIVAGDADRDGVSDADDLCPDTPHDYPADAFGCALDGDEDGVADGADRCPDTKKGGAGIDAAGCSEQDRKTDRPFRYSSGVG